MVARFALPIIAWIAIAAAMNMAALAIAKERERDTLTVLLLTDLSPAEVVGQKFLGILGATRGLVYWQLIVGIPAVLCGAFTWWAFLGLLVTQVVLTLGAVALGLVASAKAATGEKAARVVAFALGGSIAGAMAAASFIAAVAGGAGAGAVFLYSLAGLIPPATLLMFGFATHAPPGSVPYFTAGVVAGWVVYLLIAWMLWRWARRRFLRACEQTRDPDPTAGAETAPPAVDAPAGAPR
jgi:ABC-type Na+ efflux pump permease subunit